MGGSSLLVHVLNVFLYDTCVCDTVFVYMYLLYVCFTKVSYSVILEICMHKNGIY